MQTSVKCVHKMKAKYTNTNSLTIIEARHCGALKSSAVSHVSTEGDRMAASS